MACIRKTPPMPTWSCPTRTTGASREWVAYPSVRIVANSSEQQAVINDGLGVAEMVFHTAGRLTLRNGFDVETDRPCLVVLVRQKGATRIAVSSPGGESAMVHLTFPQTGQRLTFELPGGEFAGKSQVVPAAIDW